MLEKIHWLGHDSYRIDGPPVIYIDPWQLAQHTPKADIILVTHDHYDHCSPPDVKALSGPSTVVVAPSAAAAKLGRATRVIAPGQRLVISGVAIEAVAAYNTNKDFHPRKAGHVGYIVTIGGQRIYHAGDTDLTPEVGQVKADIALLPVSGVYVMTADEAAKAATEIRPRIAIPMHYGSIAGTASDAERFRDLCAQAGIEVRILQKEQ